MESSINELEKKFNDLEHSIKEKFAEELKDYTFIKPCDRMDVLNGCFVKYLKIGDENNKLTCGFSIKNNGVSLTLKSTNSKFAWSIKFCNHYVFYKKIEHNSFKRIILEYVDEHGLTKEREVT